MWGMTKETIRKFDRFSFIIVLRAHVFGGRTGFGEAVYEIVQPLAVMATSAVTAAAVNLLKACVLCTLRE